MSISVGWNDFKDSIVNGQKGDIEGTTTEIENQDILLSFLFANVIYSHQVVDTKQNIQDILKVKKFLKL